MKPHQMEPGRGDEHAELLDELQRIEQQVRGTVPSGVGQLVEELTAGAFRQPLHRQGRAEEVPAQVLELLSGVSGQGDVGVE